MSWWRAGRNKFHVVLLTLLTLAVAGWYGWRWHLAARQETQGREVPALLTAAASGPVTGYEPPPEVAVTFVRYGKVNYRQVPVYYQPLLLAEEVRVTAFGYEPDKRPWMRQAALTGRVPHLAVVCHEFASETAALAAHNDTLPGFAVDFVDPRGITYLRREEPEPLAANDIALVRHGATLWIFDAADDPVGLRAVAAAGFRYGGPAALPAAADSAPAPRDAVSR